MNSPTSQLPARRARSGVQHWQVSIGLLLLAGGLWYVASSAGWMSAEETHPLEGAKVLRGPLQISITTRGNLKAADSVSLRSEIEGRTAILTLIPEGTHVKAGDVVCELDATTLTERRFQQSLAVSSAEAARVKAQQNFEIQQSQNRSDIASAKQKLDFAEQDLKKFMEGERASELEKAKQAIDLAKEESARAADKLAWSVRLSEKGFLTSSELDADRIAHHRGEVMMLQAARDLDLLERFQLPRKEAELRAALEEAQRERERVELQAKAHLVDFESDLRTNEAKSELEQEKLAKVESQIDKARMRAPRDGLVVYAQRDSDEPPIQEGTEVRERQEVLTIPGSGGMIAQAKLHESVLKQVEVGLACTVQVDALPGQQFEGRVTYVAVLPDQNSWWSNPNTRLYRADITVDAPSPEMRPGMTCAIEILVERLPETQYVPVQAVFQEQNETFCYVSAQRAIERRPVKVGRFTALSVQILDGLAEGETVLLSRPAGLDPAASDTPAAGSATVEPSVPATQ